MSAEHFAARELKSFPIDTQLLYKKDDGCWHTAQITKYKEEDNTLHVRVLDQSDNIQIPLKLYHV